MHPAPNESDSFVVPKQRTPVDVLLADGTWHKCAMFLSARSGLHDGPERVSDLLAQAAEFLPLHDEQSGCINIVGRAGIAAVRVEPWAEAAPETSDLPIEHAVALHLVGGERLEGVLTFAARPDRARVVDHLNDGEKFLVLQEASTVTLVNKQHVVRVELR